MDEISDTLRATLRARKVADKRYLEAIRLAKEQGWSNCRIARELGLSEAAIRFYIRRNAPDQLLSSDALIKAS
jgi:predicted transcriptional regulator